MMSAGAFAPTAFGPEPIWAPVEVFTGEQRMTCDVRIRGRLRDRRSDSEVAILVRNVSTLQSAPSLPRLSVAPEGLLWRSRIVACAPLSPEPADPDAPPLAGRPVLFEGAGWSIAALAQFPSGIDPAHHVDQLMKGRFWPVREARLTVDWGPAPSSWAMPEAYVNLEHMAAAYLA